MTPMRPPRAEFRVFQPGLLKHLKAHLPEAVFLQNSQHETTHDLYILSARDQVHNVKIRHGHLKVKRWLGQTPEGFDIYQSQGKFAFPITGETVREVFATLGLTFPKKAKTYDHAAFLALLNAHPSVTTRVVRKKRHKFMLNDTVCELATVQIDKHKVESFCCESTDPQAVDQVVQAVGLTLAMNTTYVDALKAR